VNSGKWLSGVLLSILCSSPLHAEQQKACQLNRFSVLPITTLPDGRFTVPATLEGQSFNFLVDTGGAVMTLTDDKAYSLGLPVVRSSMELRGVAGSKFTGMTFVGSFSLGRLQGKNIPFYIDSRLPAGADGTLSPDVMKQYDVDIDPVHGSINLFSPEHCPGKVVYWTNGGYIVLPMSVVSNGHIEIPVMVDGKKFTAVLDTGAVESIINMDAAKAFGITEKSPELKPVTDNNSRYKEYDYPFKLLDFNGVTVTKPRLHVVSSDFLPRGIDMLIGVSILRRLHLYIAYGEEKLYITPATQN
jgi:predicted aspartyl protease